MKSYEFNKTGWWFGSFFNFSIYWEYSFQLTNIFQMGWNHQPVQVCEIWNHTKQNQLWLDTIVRSIHPAIHPYYYIDTQMVSPLNVSSFFPAAAPRFSALELLEDQLLDLLRTGPLERREAPRFVLHPGASVNALDALDGWEILHHLGWF